MQNSLRCDLIAIMNIDWLTKYFSRHIHQFSNKSVAINQGKKPCCLDEHDKCLLFNTQAQKHCVCVCVCAYSCNFVQNTFKWNEIYEQRKFLEIQVFKPPAFERCMHDKTTTKKKNEKKGNYFTCLCSAQGWCKVSKIVEPALYGCLDFVIALC